MQRLFALVSATTLLFAFAACGDDGDGTDNPDASNTAADAANGADGAGGSDAGVLARCQGFSTAPLDGSVEIDVGGRTRVADVHVPASYNPQTATPVVLNFHGYSSNAVQQAALARMTAKSDAEGFIAVHPNGVGVLQSWNGGACCGTAAQQDVDDVAFVSALIDELAATLCVDPARVYAAGMSNGGFLSHRLACELEDRIAAIGPVAGVLGIAECSPTRAVPVMHFHGTADAVVAYDGNALAGYPSAPDVFMDWMTRNGCTGQDTTFDEGDATCVSALGCDANATVTLCTITGGGHTWPGGISIPGGGVTSTDISATDEMWQFFLDHPHPSPAPLP